MIYPIVAWGSPVLRKVSEDIPKDSEDLPKLIEDMFETMYVSDGMGLAAPQIGKSLRLFIIDLTPLADEEPELEDFKKVFINAKIVHREGEPWAFNEGCLSIPHIREDIYRPETIKIQYYDEHFNYFEEEYSGLIARVIQHEYDHLEGVLFTDLVSALKKKLLKGKLRDISNGKVKTSYRMVFPQKK